MGYITKEISYHYATEHDIYIVFSEMVRTLQQFNDFLLKIAHFEFYDSPITHFHFPWSCKFFCRENCYPTTKGYIYMCIYINYTQFISFSLTFIAFSQQITRFPIPTGHLFHTVLLVQLPQHGEGEVRRGKAQQRWRLQPVVAAVPQTWGPRDMLLLVEFNVGKTIINHLFMVMWGMVY